MKPLLSSAVAVAVVAGGTATSQSQREPQGDRYRRFVFGVLRNEFAAERFG